MAEKLTPPPQPDKKEGSPSPAQAGARGSTQPLNPGGKPASKPVAPLDAETQARLKKLLGERKQSRQAADAARKDQPAPLPSGPPPPKAQAAAAPSTAPAAQPAAPPARPDSGGARPKNPAWPAAAKVLGPTPPAAPADSTPTPAPARPADSSPAPATGTEPLNLRPADRTPAPPGPVGANLLNRAGADLKTGPLAKPGTDPLRPVPKERIAQETWKVTFQAVAGSQVKAIGVEVKGLIVAGRLDPASDAKPDLDLTPYGADRHGVSRQHLILFLTDEGPCVMDLNSTNGTWINGLYLEPGRKYRLRSGDRLELGSLKMLLRVMTPAEQAAPAAPGETEPGSAPPAKPKAG